MAEVAGERDLVGAELLSARVDQAGEVVVGVVAEAGVRAVDLGGVQQGVPGRLAVLGHDGFLDEVQNDSLHRGSHPSTKPTSSVARPREAAVSGTPGALACPAIVVLTPGCLSKQ